MKTAAGFRFIRLQVINVLHSWNIKFLTACIISRCICCFSVFLFGLLKKGYHLFSRSVKQWEIQWEIQSCTFQNQGQKKRNYISEPEGSLTAEHKSIVFFLICFPIEIVSTQNRFQPHMRGHICIFAQTCVQIMCPRDYSEEQE